MPSMKFYLMTIMGVANSTLNPWLIEMVQMVLLPKI